MLVLKGHTNSVQALAYTPNGDTLVSAGDDRSIRLWDIQRGQQCAILWDHTDAILSLSISSDGRLLASGGHDRQVRLWDLTGRRLLETFQRFDSSVNAVAISPDSKWLASGADRTENETLRVLDLESGALLGLQSNAAPLTASYSSVWPVWSLAFAPDSAALAVGWGSGIVEIFDLASARTLQTLPHASGITGLSFSLDGAWLATLSANIVTVWDRASNSPVRTLSEHTGRTWSVAFTPDGYHLVTAGWDSTVRLWDVRSGRERRRFDWQIGNRINAVAIAPDGLTAAAAGASHDIVIWDVDEL